MPYEHPLSWRCYLTPVEDLLPGGLQARELVATHCYSSADGNHYFGWEDAEEAGAVELASLFEERFSDLLKRCGGEDQDYAHWLATLLDRLHDTNDLPVLTAEDLSTPADELRRLPIKVYREEQQDWVIREDFPLPPPPLS